MIAGTVPVMNSRIDLNQLSEDQLRHLVAQMLVTLCEKDTALNETSRLLSRSDERTLLGVVGNKKLLNSGNVLDEIAALRDHTT